MNTLDVKPLREVTLEDLLSLKESQVKEGRSIEYKERLPGPTDSDKKEFLADVSSFANAAGGHILFGVRGGRDVRNDANGFPDEFPGVSEANLDTLMQRLDSLLQSGIEPRIPGIEIHSVQGTEGTPVVLMRIPRSWAAPHMVEFQSWSRFFSRNSSGKYRLDVSELRAAFVRAEASSEYIRKFQAERLGRVVAGETPVPLPAHPLAVLHVVPLAAVDATATVDLRPAVANPGHMPPMGASGWNNRLNFDGFVTFEGRDQEEASLAYTQVFRNGAIEAVSVLTLLEQQRRIGVANHEVNMVDALRQYLGLQEQMGVATPVAVAVSMLGVRGYEVALGPQHLAAMHGGVDRDALVGVPSLVEDLNLDPAGILKPSFDALWNAFGYPKSTNYDSDGNWRRR